MAELREGVSAEIIKAMSVRALDAYNRGVLYVNYRNEEEEPLGNIIVRDTLASNRQPRERTHSLILKVLGYAFLNDRDMGIQFDQLDSDKHTVTETITNESFNWKTPVSPELLEKYSDFSNKFTEFHYLKP